MKSDPHVTTTKNDAGKKKEKRNNGHHFIALLHSLFPFFSSFHPISHSPQELQCHYAPATSTTGCISDRTMGLARTNIPPGRTLGLWPRWRRLFEFQGRALDRRKGNSGYGGEEALQGCHFLCLSFCLSVCISAKTCRLTLPHWILIDFTFEESSPLVQMLPRVRPYVPQMIEPWPQDIKASWMYRQQLMMSIDDSVAYKGS